MKAWTQEAQMWYQAGSGTGGYLGLTGSSLKSQIEKAHPAFVDFIVNGLSLPSFIPLFVQ